MSYIKRGREDVEKVFIDTIGGKGKMHITQFMGKDAALPQVDGFPDDFDSSLHFLHELILEPGTEIGEHTHEGSEEIYFMVEGTGEMTVDGEVVEMKEGDAVLAKNNATHSFVVTSETPVKLFVVEAGV
ncbi:cupin domain-containing protein [Fuchsiella alkaliacetigena]|uniref:cupin domain-containing protein n=1 Tax=Fuchsiella alkaliacetigena TaxID=957042 RepID=UPI00200ACCDE|nr:cupin domain-containing protein [Fuchsiella alkaliacetigena]MCK8824206.1 cupin domain-containing protein [Fuchsiella alkaliacetigena]